MNKLSIALSLALSLAPMSIASAYEGGAVSNGGTIAGVIKFKGTAPAPKKLEVNKDKEVCAKVAKTDSSLIVSGDNLVNAVVYLTDIRKGKKMEIAKVTMDQNGCEYKPHVLALPVGSSVDFLNPDGILHNVRTESKKNSPMNMAQPKFKKTLTQKFDKAEMISVKCDVHGWMSGWLFVAANPYFQVTDSSGLYKLTDVPAGDYTLEVWHGTLGTQSKKVTVKAKEAAKVDFESQRNSPAP
ncbi:MAG: carboxypeptidase regulatory-like domain-containing protein [Candidatus Binatia bacterium]